MDNFRKFLFAKIHGATVTHADVNYEGSITIPPSLLQSTGMAGGEAVWVWNVTNGARFETYIIPGETEEIIAINGAAARLVQIGDKVIIAAFCLLPFRIDGNTVDRHEPAVVFVDEKNRLTEKRKEIVGAK